MKDSTAFHPAVQGVLYVALREHQESRAAAEAVAGLYDTSASIAYHAEVIESLKLAITLLNDHETAIAARLADQGRRTVVADARLVDEGSYGPDALACARCNALDGYDAAQDACLHCAYATAGRVVAALGQYPVYACEVKPGYVEIQHVTSGASDAQIRAELREIAGLFALEYGEQQEGDGDILVSAAGELDGSKVQIWNYVRSADDGIPAVAGRPRRGASLWPAHAAMGECLLLLSGEPIVGWVIGEGTVKAHLWVGRDGQREAMQALAARLGWEYHEIPRPADTWRLEVSGTVGGFPVQVWAYAPAVGRPSTDIDDVADAAGLSDVQDDLPDWDGHLLECGCGDPDCHYNGPAGDVDGPGGFVEPGQERVL